MSHTTSCANAHISRSCTRYEVYRVTAQCNCKHELRRSGRANFHKRAHTIPITMPFLLQGVQARMRLAHSGHANVQKRVHANRGIMPFWFWGFKLGHTEPIQVIKDKILHPHMALVEDAGKAPGSPKPIYLACSFRRSQAAGEAL